MSTKCIVILAFILLLILSFSNEIMANEFKLFSTISSIFDSIDFPFSINFPLPLFSNLSLESFSSFLFDIDFAVLYHLNSFLRLGLYLECMFGFFTLIDTFEILAWTLSWFMLLPLIFEWPFPEFHETAFDFHFGIVLNLEVIKLDNFKIDLVCKIGYGNFSCDLMNYEQSIAFFFIPELILKFPFSRGGIGIDIGYQLSLITEGFYKGQLYYFPEIGIYFYFNNR